MSQSIAVSEFQETILRLFGETFFEGNHFYLGKETSFFETLEHVDATRASQAASSKVGTLAAQIEHTAYYIENNLAYLTANGQEVTFSPDWEAAWRRTSVTDHEWRALIDALREQVRRFREFVQSQESWDVDLMSDAMAVVVHSAYHLGEVRQALGVIPNPNRPQQ